jgi:hypothetical protein
MRFAIMEVRAEVSPATAVAAGLTNALGRGD